MEHTSSTDVPRTGAKRVAASSNIPSTRPSAAPENLAQQLADIQASLAEIQRDLAERRRQDRAMEDLREDLTRVAKDVLDSAVRELDDVAPFVHTGDFTNLMKKLLRNTNRIAEGFDKLDSAVDFMRDATPISHDVFRAAITKMDELERKGYFRVAADLQATTDALVRLLGSWGVLPALRSALESAATEGPDGVEHYSLFRVYRATKRPEIRKLLGAAVLIVGRFAAELDRRGRRNALDVPAEPAAALAE